MPDTCVMKIVGKDNFEVKDYALFNPEFKTRTYADLTENERRKHDNLPLQKFIMRSGPDKQRYYPKVEIFENFHPTQERLEYSLRLESSLPKLIFGNNLQEIEASNRENILFTLEDRLKMMGIAVRTSNLSRALVTAIHFGKNTFLPENILHREIVDELIKTAINQTEDVTRTQHKNSGEVLQIYSGVREYAFYDKVRDLRKPSNRRTDKGAKTSVEKDLFTSYPIAHRECFRFEYRLKHAPTLRKEINMILGRKHDVIVTFNDLFSETLWKQILWNAWRKLIEIPHNKLALFVTANNEQMIFTHMMKIIRQGKKNAHSQNKMIIAYGISQILKHIGVKMVKDEFSRTWSAKAAERLEEKFKIAIQLTEGLTYSDRIMFIDKALEEFRRIDSETLRTHKIDRGVILNEA